MHNAEHLRLKFGSSKDSIIQHSSLHNQCLIPAQFASKIPHILISPAACQKSSLCNLLEYEYWVFSLNHLGVAMFTLNVRE